MTKQAEKALRAALSNFELYTAESDKQAIALLKSLLPIRKITKAKKGERK